jgi:hypothetical protein
MMTLGRILYNEILEILSRQLIPAVVIVVISDTEHSCSPARVSNINILRRRDFYISDRELLCTVFWLTIRLVERESVSSLSGE